MDDFFKYYDDLPIGIIVTNSSKTIIYINQATADMTSYNQNELTGRKCDILFGSQCSAKGCCFETQRSSAANTVEMMTRNGDSIIADKKECLVKLEKDGEPVAIELISPAPKENLMTFEMKRNNEKLNYYLLQLENILDVGLIITSSLSINRILLRIINILKSTFNYETVFILIPDETGKLGIAARTSLNLQGDQKDEVIDPEHSYAPETLKEKKAILVNDVQNEKERRPFISSSRSELFVPMIAQERLLGVLIATSTKPMYFSKRDIEILTKIANFAAAAINNAQLAKLIKTSRDQYEILFEKSSDPILISDIDGTRFLDVNNRASEVYGYSKEEFLKMNTIQLLENPDLKDNKIFKAFKEDWEGMHLTKDSIAFYVETRTSVIEYMNQKANQTIIRDISERKKFEEELRILSITDELTQLYNRYYFMQSLQNEILRAKRYENPLSLMMVDVDSFKPFNDKYGHQAGDKLLRDIGVILHTSLRSIDVPCRYGGDEFSIILPHTSKEEAKIIADRILHHYSQRDYTETGLSIGISTMTEDDTEQTLIHKADTALYYVKKELGRGRIIQFSDIKV